MYTYDYRIVFESDKQFENEEVIKMCITLLVNRLKREYNCPVIRDAIDKIL